MSVKKIQMSQMSQNFAGTGGKGSHRQKSAIVRNCVCNNTSFSRRILTFRYKLNRRRITFFWGVGVGVGVSINGMLQISVTFTSLAVNKSQWNNREEYG